MGAAQEQEIEFFAALPIFWYYEGAIAAPDLRSRMTSAGARVFTRWATWSALADDEEGGPRPQPPALGAEDQGPFR